RRALGSADLARAGGVRRRLRIAARSAAWQDRGRFSVTRGRAAPVRPGECPMLPRLTLAGWLAAVLAIVSPPPATAMAELVADFNQELGPERSGSPNGF